ncbi:MAG TPA: RNA 2',3'-cyclic phosphodiesterase [Solirubrobacteraceae bacterium]|nr:RNA 2',3'-cyclic phosphodiesterase [Solirubrobacteraceae bacterium]
MTLRLFVALELPPSAVGALAAFRDTADPAIWRAVPDESLHVTLAFLGASDPAVVERVGETLRAAVGDAPAPALALGGALLLPPRRARVLCGSVSDPQGALAALQARVAGGLVEAGALEPESRPFRAHVTVARLRPRARAPREVDGAAEPVAFAAGPVTLFASHTHPAGARYEALISARFRS